MDRKRRRGIRQGGRRAKIGVEPVAFYGDMIESQLNYEILIRIKDFDTFLFLDMNGINKYRNMSGKYRHEKIIRRGRALI